MSFKEYVESNPLTVIIGLSAAVATTTAGTVQFISDKVHKAELIQISTKHTAAITDLQTRLVSIERKIGEGESFFDVSRLILPPSDVKSLSAKYRTIGDSSFYIAEPGMKGWSYELTSEYALAKESVIFNNEKSSPFDLLESALGKKNLHLWKNESTIRFKPKMNPDEDSNVTFNFFPHVAVQVLKVSDLVGMASNVTDAMNSTSEIEEILNKISNLLSEVDTEATNEDHKEASSTNGISEENKKRLEKSKAKLKIEADLSKLFRGDLASVMLAAISKQIVSMPVAFPGATSSLETVQKKGNVLYIQSTLSFPGVTVEDAEKQSTVKVYQEFLIASNTENLFFIKVQIPTTDGRSTAFSWVSQWLSGIRIPFKTI